MPEQPVERLGEKEYTVIGPHDVFGLKTGESGKFNLTADEERYYLEAGHLKVKYAKNPPKEGE